MPCFISLPSWEKLVGKVFLKCFAVSDFWIGL